MLRNRVPILAIISLLIAVLVFASSCDRPAPNSVSAGQQKLSVLATAYPMADVAREVGGASISAQWLAESGQPIASLDPNAELRNRLRLADLVITGGASEPWAVEGFDDAYRARRIIRLDALPAARDLATTDQLWLDPKVMSQLALELV